MALKSYLAGELPPRMSSVFLISGSEEEHTLVRSYLETHEYTVIESCWVKNDLLSKDFDFLVHNEPSSAIIWEASPVLKGVIEKIEELRFESEVNRAGVAIDLGCGSGRDCVFLAHRGWCSTGYDYLDDSIERAKRLAARYGTEIDTHVYDLEKDDAATAEYFANTKADLVNVSRYLHRPLLPVIAEMINPGGFVVYHQFMVGCTKPRRARFLLQEGELAAFFSQRGFEILEDRVFPISDGRPCCWFLARKKSS